MQRERISWQEAAELRLLDEAATNPERQVMRKESVRVLAQYLSQVPLRDAVIFIRSTLLRTTSEELSQTHELTTQNIDQTVQSVRSHILKVNRTARPAAAALPRTVTVRYDRLHNLLADMRGLKTENDPQKIRRFFETLYTQSENTLGTKYSRDLHNYWQQQFAQPLQKIRIIEAFRTALKVGPASRNFFAIINLYSNAITRLKNKDQLHELAALLQEAHERRRSYGTAFDLTNYYPVTIPAVLDARKEILSGQTAFLRREFVKLEKFIKLLPTSYRVSGSPMSPAPLYDILDLPRKPQTRAKFSPHAFDR